MVSGRKSAAQAKRDKDDAILKTAISNLTVEGLAGWNKNFEQLTAHVPVSWLDSIQDMLVMRGEELNSPKPIRGYLCRSLDADYRATVGLMFGINRETRFRSCLRRAARPGARQGQEALPTVPSSRLKVSLGCMRRSEGRKGKTVGDRRCARHDLRENTKPALKRFHLDRAGHYYPGAETKRDAAGRRNQTPTAPKAG